MYVYGSLQILQNVDGHTTNKECAHTACDYSSGDKDKKKGGGGLTSPLAFTSAPDCNKI